jgi:Tol biopolymer transport system component
MRSVPRVLAALCVLALVGLLCGCGGSGGVTGPSVATAGKPPPPPPPPPPTSDRIVFQKFVGTSRNGGDQLFVMNSDGTGVTQLTFGSRTNTNQLAAWNSSATRIAFNSNRDGGNRPIYVMNADGSGQTLVTSLGYNDQTPDWQPGDGLIAFERVYSANDGLYVVDPTRPGTEQRLLGTGPSDNWTRWSPSGGLIAFINVRTRDPQGIYAITPVTSGTPPTPVFVAYGNYPSWSPSGDKIAYVSEDLLWWIPVDPATGQPTGSPVQLTTTADPYLGWSTWSPDGQFVAYHAAVGTTKGFAYHILKISVTTKQVADLGEGTRPDWSP